MNLEKLSAVIKSLHKHRTLYFYFVLQYVSLENVFIVTIIVLFEIFSAIPSPLPLTRRHGNTRRTHKAYYRFSSVRRKRTETVEFFKKTIASYNRGNVRVVAGNNKTEMYSFRTPVQYGFM